MTPQAVGSATQLIGLDVSAYQGVIDWNNVAANGGRFAYVKATEGTTYTNASFASQYNGAYAAGLTRGAYAFAHPNADAAAQATYFVDHGGRWTADGRTLPPLLDIEYGSASQGGTCWGVSASAMVSWISTFTATVRNLTGISPAIYSTTDWWSRCTGNTSLFSADPLFIAHYTSATTPGTLPNGWSTWTMWQWADAGTFPGDQDVFHGDANALKILSMGAKSIAVSGYATPTKPYSVITGRSLASNQSIYSPNMQYQLWMAPSGSLAIRGNGRTLWHTSTSSPGATLSMQSDGNLVIYSKAGKAIWASATTGSNGILYMRNSGEMAVVTSNGTVWTNSATGSNMLSGTGGLKAGMYLHDVTGSVQLIMQADGNLVLYISGVARWNAHTNGHPGSSVTLQSDGNLVVYDPTHKALWNSHTNGTGTGNRLTVGNDGSLLLQNASLKTLWTGKTHI